MERDKPLWKKALKVWTYITIPLEVFLVGHGIYTKNLGEAAVGGIGLALDYFTLKWMDREKSHQTRQEAKGWNPLSLIGLGRGSQRINQSARLATS